MKRLLILLILALLAISTALSEKYTGSNGRWLLEGQTLNTDDKSTIDFTVNVDISRITSYIRIGFAENTTFTDDIKSYMADSVKVKHSVSFIDKGNGKAKVDDAFSLFYAVVSPTNLSIKVSLGPLESATTNQSLAWSTTLGKEDTITLSSDDSSEIEVDKHDASTNLISYGNIPVTAMEIDNYYSVGVDEYSGYLYVSVSSS